MDFSGRVQKLKEDLKEAKIHIGENIDKAAKSPEFTESYDDYVAFHDSNREIFWRRKAEEQKSYAKKTNKKQLTKKNAEKQAKKEEAEHKKQELEHKKEQDKLYAEKQKRREHYKI